MLDTTRLRAATNRGKLRLIEAGAPRGRRLICAFSVDDKLSVTPHGAILNVREWVVCTRREDDAWVSDAGRVMTKPFIGWMELHDVGADDDYFIPESLDHLKELLLARGWPSWTMEAYASGWRPPEGWKP